MSIRIQSKEYEFVLYEEKLLDWAIFESVDGLCMREQKIILCKYDDLPLFLHEVAHALIDKETDIKMGDKTGHHSIFADTFTNLVRKYMKSKIKQPIT